MNIKSIAPNIMPLEQIRKNESKEKVRTLESQERDANGKQERGDEEHHPPMTQEEWLEAVEKIKALPAVVKNNLTVTWVQEGHVRVVKIMSASQEVVRRLSEKDVRDAILQIDIERPKGQLLDKAM
ncbi:MAG: hypothetical protein KDD34_03705 [Bdellovibrionales bacterium]|nr:hypothetical protein [Bdellovibrionales bacterium]